MSSPIRIDMPGYPYHVYCRGNNKQPIFLENRDYERFLDKLLLYKTELGVKIHSFTLIPNHFHLEIEPLKTGPSVFMHRLMTSHSKYFTIKYEFVGHPFQDRYQSILIDKDDYFLTVSRYIHLNSVEAGLSINPADYKWSSYGIYLKEDTQDKLVTIEDTLKYFSDDKNIARVKYREFVEGKEEIVDPLIEQKRGILGKPYFIKEIERITRRI